MVQDHPLAHLIEPLKATDRCDRCGSQAYIGVLVSTASKIALLFCAHHGAQYLPALRFTALAIRDETHRLAPVAAQPDDRR